MEYSFNKENIEKVEKFIEIRNRGLYADGRQVTEVYNEVLHKTVPPTNCGSCIRGRITELENAYNAFKSLSEASNTSCGTVDHTEEEKPSEKPKRARKGGK